MKKCLSFLQNKEVGIRLKNNLEILLTKTSTQQLNE